MSATLPKVAVYVDWQNVYKSARYAFGLESMPNEHGNFSPYQLARVLAAGNGRGPDGFKLVRLEIHRGLPDSTREPVGYGANRRQAAAWMKENPEIVIPAFARCATRGIRTRRRWRRNRRQIALAAVEHVMTDLCDVAIIFSHDTDLLPAIETIARLRDAHRIETASWSSDWSSSRLRPKGVGVVYNHYISEPVFRRVETPINFAHESSR